MHAFGIYATLTPTHNGLSRGHIFSWGGRIFCNVESLMVILLSLSLAYFSPSSSGGLTMILRSYCTETCNNNFGICFWSFRQYIPTDNNLRLEIAQPEDDVESNGKGVLCPFGLFFYEHGAL